MLRTSESLGREKKRAFSVPTRETERSRPKRNDRSGPVGAAIDPHLGSAYRSRTRRCGSSFHRTIGGWHCSTCGCLVNSTGGIGGFYWLWPVITPGLVIPSFYSDSPRVSWFTSATASPTGFDFLFQLQLFMGLIWQVSNYSSSTKFAAVSITLAEIWFSFIGFTGSKSCFDV